MRNLLLPPALRLCSSTRVIKPESAVVRIELEPGCQGHEASIRQAFTRSVECLGFKQRELLFGGDKPLSISCVCESTFTQLMAGDDGQVSKHQSRNKFGFQRENRIVVREDADVSRLTLTFTNLMLHALVERIFKLPAGSKTGRIRNTLLQDCLIRHRNAQLEKAGLDESTLHRYKQALEKKVQDAFTARVHDKLDLHFVSLEATYHAHPDVPAMEVYLNREQNSQKPFMREVREAISHGSLAQSLFAIPFFIALKVLAAIQWVLHALGPQDHDYFVRYYSESVLEYFIESWTFYLVSPRILQACDAKLFAGLDTLQKHLEVRGNLDEAQAFIILRKYLNHPSQRAL